MVIRVSENQLWCTIFEKGVGRFEDVWRKVILRKKKRGDFEDIETNKQTKFWF